MDFIRTDVWVSMGESADRRAQRIELLRDYQVISALMAASGNARVRFMHCLPAFHNLESPAGIQFEQAENRVNSIKALLVATLGS